MKSVKVFLGLLTGFAAGALAGIMFSPEKGSKTRNNLLKKGENYSDVLKEKFDGLFKVVTKEFEKVKSEVTRSAEKKMPKPEEAEKKSEVA